MNILDLAQQDTQLKQVTTSKGGEWAGPCPLAGCGGTDRFHVWPETGRWWCRQCNARGDVIEYFRRVRGLSFKEACRASGRDLVLRTPRPIDPASYATTKAHAAFDAWIDQQCDVLHAARLVLTQQHKEAELFFRLLHHYPALFTSNEYDYWIQTLGKIYDRLADLDMQLEQLTDPETLPDRFQRWREEHGHG